MKRLRFHGEERNENRESFDLANVLMLLSTGSTATAFAAAAAGGPEAAVARVFECRTCNRQFSSFQALGGHRASHKKPRMAGGEEGPGQVSGGPAKPRVHECSVCGLEFPIGQALGGHMRRHRAAAAERIRPNRFGWAGEKEAVGEKMGVGFDLNLRPPVEAEEVTRLPKILGFTLTTGTVNYFL